MGLSRKILGHMPEVKDSHSGTRHQIFVYKLENILSEFDQTSQKDKKIMIHKILAPTPKVKLPVKGQRSNLCEYSKMTETNIKSNLAEKET